jgi:rare lipoprotein A
MMRQTFFALACLCTLIFSGATLSSFAQKARMEYGKCGYYADSFQDRPTSNGEKYDKNALTCSHKSLPFGTEIRVTRIDNKKSVVVRVNDRGPFIEGYVVDVSGAAAKALDLLKVGTTRVKVEVLGQEETTSAGTKKAALSTAGNTKLLVSHKGESAAKPVTYNQDDPKPAETEKAAGTGTAEKAAPTTELYKVDIKKSEKSGFGIQISTLFDANNVLPIINTLQGQWPNKVMVAVSKDEANEQTAYKIIVGPYTSKKAAETQQKLVSRKGYKKTLIVDLGEM